MPEVRYSIKKGQKPTEDQIKAAEWARSEYQRLQREKENRLSLELMERMTPLLKKNSKR